VEVGADRGDIDGAGFPDIGGDHSVDGVKIGTGAAGATDHFVPLFVLSTYTAPFPLSAKCHT
jgi:hypothetical protein